MKQSGWTLALVDDEPWALVGIRDIIPWSEYGFQKILTFASAEDAIEALEKRSAPIDALITDIRLPEMDGIEMASRLLDGGVVRTAVIISAYRDFEYARRAVREGVLYYLLKPLDVKEVRQVAERLLERLSREQIAEGHVGEPLQAPFNNNYVLLRSVPVEAGEDTKVLRIPGNTRLLAVSAKAALWKETQPIGVSLKHSGFADLATMIREAELSARYGIGFSCHEITGTIQAMIAEGFDKRLAVADFAEQFNFSEVYLSDSFKRHAGTTLHSFIIDIRIKESLILLRDPQLTVAEIAARVGYPDAGYFGRIFRKRLGVSPEQYRLRDEKGKAEG